MVMAYR